MNQGKYVFSQLMAVISHKEFTRCVTKYSGDHKVKDFNCWKQFLCMAFGQLTQRESLSDTILCLSRLEGKLYHLGVGKSVSKSTLSKANENRDWRIYAELAQELIEEAKRLYSTESLLDIDVKQNVFAIDATVIDLCLSVFPWAKFRRAKSAVKLTTQLNLKNAIPEFIAITSAVVHEVSILDQITFERDSFYVMDRGYIDFSRLNRIHRLEAFFVIRAKVNFKFVRISSNQSGNKPGIICDQTIKLKNKLVATYYPEPFRRIKFFDRATNRTFVFLTNNFEVGAIEIAQLYKHRWMIELFFKWIKQHLKIKSFWGHSANAVKTQIWIAISVYVLIAIVKKQLRIERSLYEMLQILSITALERTPIKDLFRKPDLSNFKEQEDNQLRIFD